jgi:hypothetical protein
MGLHMAMPLHAKTDVALAATFSNAWLVSAALLLRHDVDISDVVPRIILSVGELTLVYRINFVLSDGDSGPVRWNPHAQNDETTQS